LLGNESSDLMLPVFEWNLMYYLFSLIESLPRDILHKLKTKVKQLNIEENQKRFSRLTFLIKNEKRLLIKYNNCNVQRTIDNILDKFKSIEKLNEGKEYSVFYENKDLEDTKAFMSFYKSKATRIEKRSNIKCINYIHADKCIDDMHSCKVVEMVLYESQSRTERMKDTKRY